MDFRRLKELVRKLGGVLVLDGDKPEFVILSYNQYEKIEAGPLRQVEVEASEVSEEAPFSTRRNGLAQPNGGGGKVIRDEEEQETVEKLNQEILALKEEIRHKEEAELVMNEQSTEAVTELVDLG